MRQIVGIDRKIKRTWLDIALDRLAQTNDKVDLRAFLDEQLKDELHGKESRAKAVGIVLRVWSGVPTDRVSLRNRAIELLPRISGHERIWLHWGMAALAYPFFRDTAEVIGRLLALQDDFTTAQVKDRILTSWGDRVTSKLAARYLLTTLVDWELLRSTKTQGHFLLTKKTKTNIPELQLWLLEALLAASAADEIEAQQLLRLPEAFPFNISVGIADLRKSEYFNIHRQGLDMDMIALRKVKLESPLKPSKNPEKKTAASVHQVNLFDFESVVFDSKNGSPDSDGKLAVTNKPMKKKDGMDELRKIEASIKNEVMQTLTDRATRFLQVRDVNQVPDGPFAAPLIECAQMFRDGHYFGCIALAHTVLEAIMSVIA